MSALTLTGIAKSYGATPAVVDLSVDVDEGSLVAVVGPSGCGKSTLLRLVAGLERPDAGSVRIGGDLVAGAGQWVPPERRRVGLVFQDHALFPHLSVRDNVAFGLSSGRGSGSAGRRGGRAARVAEMLDLVHLGHLAERHPHELSGGEQQRVALARALAPGPDVVLLDEPFSSLDEGLRARVRAETVGALRHTGTTAVLVTHDQDEALSVGDRVVVMRAGVVEQQGCPVEVYERPASRFVATFMGDADVLSVSVVGREALFEFGRVATASDQVSEVVVRPHEVALTVVAGPGGGASAGGVEGHVVAADYRGARIVHTVRLPSGSLVRSWQPPSVRHEPGTRVWVGLVPGISPTLLADGRRIG